MLPCYPDIVKVSQTRRFYLCKLIINDRPSGNRFDIIADANMCGVCAKVLQGFEILKRRDLRNVKMLVLFPQLLSDAPLPNPWNFVFQIAEHPERGFAIFLARPRIKFYEHNVANHLCSGDPGRIVPRQTRVVPTLRVVRLE